MGMTSRRNTGARGINIKIGVRLPDKRNSQIIPDRTGIMARIIHNVKFEQTETE
jgi:hypothetical protein